MVQDLEQKISNLHKVKHCVAVCNGTMALEIAIRALSLSGEVIVPSYTFIATANALRWLDITPLFADINLHNHNIDPDAVRRMVTANTTGIIGVHLWGNVAAVEDLEAIADEFNLKLIFDAAHAFACANNGKMVGNFGNCEVFSFHATKFFNTFEGGAIVTNDDALAEKMRLMRNFGFAGLDNAVELGVNGKMIEIAAAMGLSNFGIIERVIQHNFENYHAYRHGLSGLPFIRLLSLDGNKQHNFQYIVIEIDEDCPVTRDFIIDGLRSENVLARKYFWPGCHKMETYKQFCQSTDLLLPNTEKVASRVVVLPTGTTVSKTDIAVICNIIGDLIGK